MKKSIFLFSCAASLFLMPAGVSRADSELGKQMEAMDDAYKVFRRETDPAKGAALAREAQEAILKGISDLPQLIKVMSSGPEKTKASAEYRKMMGELYTALCSVEVAFLNNDLDEVATIVGTLRDMKKEGHNKFMEE